MSKLKQVALIADTFPPFRTSGAVQLRDLALEFLEQGYELTVLLPSSELNQVWQMEDFKGVNILRLRAPRAKGASYLKRTLAEFMMPFSMKYALKKSPLKNTVWDAVIWYAPSIFHTPLVKYLKNKSGCKGYLIIRDIFPNWAVDLGLMNKGLAYAFFSLVANYQYQNADIIGVQSSGNLKYFDSWKKKIGKNLEVLENWLGQPSELPCSINLSQSLLSGREIFVYAGNMGVAQGLEILLELAEHLQRRKDIGFVFVGRGSEYNRLQEIAANKRLNNTLFYDEIEPDEIPKLYEQCSVGLVCLHPKHKSCNIPGKFLTYIQNGLPVLANINPDNDLANLILKEKVGQVCETNQVAELERLAEDLLDQIHKDKGMPKRCLDLFECKFSVTNAVKKIVHSLSKNMV